MLNYLEIFFVSIMLSCVFSIIGTVTIANKNSFFDHSLCHSLLLPTSIGIAMNFDKINIYIMNIAFCVIFSFLYVYLLKKDQDRQNILSFISFISIGVFVIISSNYKIDEESVETYLTGSSKINFEKIIRFLILFSLIIFTYIKTYKVLILKGINKELAFIKDANIYRKLFIFLFLESLLILELIDMFGFFISYISISMTAVLSKNLSNNFKDFLIKNFIVSFLSILSSFLMEDFFSFIPFSSFFIIFILFFAFILGISMKFYYAFINKLSER